MLHTWPLMLHTWTTATGYVAGENLGDKIQWCSQCGECLWRTEGRVAQCPRCHVRRSVTWSTSTGRG